MKKIILTAILFIAFAFSLSAQVKVNYYLTNARYSGTTWYIDLYATVQTGQNWKVGPTCIRMDYWTTTPDHALTLVEASPVDNANTNLSNTNIYLNMTTTSIFGTTSERDGVSLNIQPIYNMGYYQLDPGSYLLGTLKFTSTDVNACINMAFFSNSAIFDNLTPLTYSSGWTKTDPPPCITGIKNESTIVPDDYSLSQNFPNPFNPVTSIRFAIPASGLVKLSVFDMLGREVASLVDDVKTPGTYLVDFDGTALSSGIYYYRIEINDFTDVKKMVLVK